MQRSFKVIKKILAYVESEQTNGPIPLPEFDGCTTAQLHEHIRLCVEAGYLEAEEPGWYEGMLLYPSLTRLTWLGHEALARLRRENCGPSG